VHAQHRKVLSLAAKGPKDEVNYLRGWEIEKEKVKGKQNEKRKGGARESKRVVR
jgi:hypothetical protein